MPRPAPGQIHCMIFFFLFFFSLSTGKQLYLSCVEMKDAHRKSCFQKTDSRSEYRQPAAVQFSTHPFKTLLLFNSAAVSPSRYRIPPRYGKLLFYFDYPTASQSHRLRRIDRCISRKFNRKLTFRRADRASFRRPPQRHPTGLGTAPGRPAGSAAAAAAARLSPDTIFCVLSRRAWGAPG